MPLPQSTGYLHKLLHSRVMKQSCHQKISVWLTRVSWNCIHLINHFREVVDFSCSWDGWPQDDSRSDFSPGCMILKRFVKFRRDFSRLTESWSWPPFSVIKLPIVETFLMSSTYLQVKNVHFEVDNWNVMFMLVFKSSMFTKIITYNEWITS